MITELEKVSYDFIAKQLENQITDQPTYFRMNHNHSRYYVTVENGIVEWYPSVTSIIKQVIPPSVGMQLLMMEKGKEFNTWMAELAHQGTFIHTEVSTYIHNRELATQYEESDDYILYSLNYFEDKIKEYFEEKRLNYDVKKWDIELRPKVVSLIKFVLDYEVEPLAIEMIVGYQNNKIQYAGACDLLANVTIEEKGFFGEVYKSGKQKGMPKETKQKVRKIALIDFKSGTSGFFDEYGIQLKMYARALYQMTGIKVDCILNVGPTKFMNGNTPGYSVKDWTDKIEDKTVDLYLDVFAMNYEKPEQIAVFDGALTPTGDISSLFRYQDADEFVLNLAKVNRQLEETI